MGVTIKKSEVKPTNYGGHLTTKPAVAVITAEKKGLPKSQHQETVHPGVSVPVQHALVTVGASRTIQTAPFESLKLHIELTFPCAPTLENVQDTYDFASEWVNSRLEEALTPPKD